MGSGAGWSSSRASRTARRRAPVGVAEAETVATAEIAVIAADVDATGIAAATGVAEAAAVGTEIAVAGTAGGGLPRRSPPARPGKCRASPPSGP